MSTTTLAAPAIAGPAPDDLGWRLVRQVHNQLRIDERWTEWHADGFTWWAHELAQRVSFEGPHDVDGVPTFWLSFETEMLRNVPDDPVVKKVVADLNRASNLNSVVVEGGRLLLRGRTYALPETAVHRSWLLAERAIIANVQAHAYAARLLDGFKRHHPRLTGIEEAASKHPVNGARALPDDMLTVVDNLYKVHGAVAVPAHKAPDLLRASRQLDALGFQFDLRLDQSALLAAGQSKGRPFMVVVEANANHPMLGRGMLTLLRIPIEGWVSLEDAADHAARLNSLQFWALDTLIMLGSWVLDTEAKEAPVLVYADFQPALSLEPSAALVAVQNALQHMRWLTQLDERVKRSS